MNKKTVVPYILMIISSIMMAAVFFLPLFKSGETMGVYAQSFMKEAFSGFENFPGMKLVARWMYIFLFMTAIFVFVNFIGAILKKPIMLLVFTPLSFVAFFIFCSPFYELIGSEYSLALGWGYGYYVFNAGALISFVSAILMLSLRNRKTPTP